MFCLPWCIHTKKASYLPLMNLYIFNKQFFPQFCSSSCPHLYIFMLLTTSKLYTIVLSISKKRHKLNTLAPGWFRQFLQKKHLNACGFAWEFLRSSMLYRPGKSLKRRGKSSSLHSKKFFLLGGCGFFVSDIISEGLLGHLGPLCLALGANR